MRRREFLAGAAGACGALGAAGAQTQRRPNIVWIMADQLRYDCVGANGNRLIQTPNIDRLAARSANCSQAFVQSPVCVPSRVSFFTGRYPHSHKNRVNYTPLDEREVLIQRMLRDAGYRTGSVGKLHYFPPTAEHARSTGFDVVRLDDGISATDPYSDYVKWRNANDPRAKLHYQATEAKPGGNPFRGAIEYKYTPTAWVGSESRAVLRELARGEQPFFLFSSFFKPHSPYTVPEPYDAMFDGVEIPLPRQVTLADIEKLPLPVRTQILRGRPQYGMDRRRLQWIYRSYYASVKMIDDEVGRLLETVRETGQEENTIVVFSTDHGDQLLAHGLEGKNVFFEESVRVPFLVALPGRVRTGRRDELIEMVDVLPTLLDLCGVAVPERVQGRSFAGLLTGGAYERREFVFAENVIPEVITNRSLDLPFERGKGVGGVRHPDAKMIRTKRWKYNHYAGNGGELYDLEADPGEERNLIADAGQAGRVREMRERLLEVLITADEVDQIAPRWRLQ
ncbi:MAG: sulfatase-like hydrolase/transferase [Acidobacteria bacterium]|nr:sulfatase-like hydrolase/transferase [Acidobacteriota bacterium]